MSGTPEWIERLGWVLVHFLWQGTALGIVAWAGSIILRKASARLRYAFFCIAFLACGMAPMATWLWLSEETGAVQTITAYTTDARANLAPRAASVGEPSLPDALSIPSVRTDTFWNFDSIFGFIHNALPYFVALWSVGVIVLSVRLAYGWGRLRQLISSGVPVPDEAWRERLSVLAEQMGVHRAVRLLESALVEVPTVIGWLRPVLLVPAMFFTALPPAQIEAIMAHELAHIRRLDYLVNLFQIVIETLLFYHPAVWWISRAIREEREDCCDDLALDTVGNKITYAKALAALEESRSLPMAITLAASGGSLTRRIRRLLGLGESSPGSKAWLIFAVLGLALLSADAVVAYAQLEQDQKAAADPFGNLDLTKATHDELGFYNMAYRNAVIADKLDLVEAFLRHGLNVNPEVLAGGRDDILGDAAFFTNDPRMVRLLLAHGAKPQGSTIRNALQSGNKEILDLIIAAGAKCDPIRYDAALGLLDDLKARDASQPLTAKEANQALDDTAQTGQIATFDWLWAKVRTGNAAADAKKMDHIYVVAAERGHLPLLLHLEQMGVKPADGGAKALQLALARNHLPEAKHLFDLGVKLLPNPKEFRGPLGEAAGQGHLEMVKLLLDHGADINAQDGEGATPLSWAAYMGHDDLCQFLIQRGADVAISDKYGHTAAWNAAGGTHCTGALALMIQKGAQVTATDKNGRNIMQYAMNFVPPEPGGIGFPGSILTQRELQENEQRERQTIDLLITAGLNPNGIPGTETPLMSALRASHYPAARALLDHQADVKVKDGQGDTAITYLFNFWHTASFPTDVLETLLQRGANPNDEFPIAGLTPKTNISVLEQAVTFVRGNPDRVAGSRDAVKTLLGAGGKFPGTSNDFDQAMLLAAARGDLDGTKKALTGGASVNAKEKFGLTPLLIALSLGYTDVGRWLLDHGADPNADTLMGTSALASAAGANQDDLVDEIIAKSVTPAQASEGLLPAIRNGNQHIFDALMKAGAKGDLVFVCIQFGRVEMAKALLDQGANPQPLPAIENRGTVYWAVYYNQPEILKMLLDHGADPEIKTDYNETPLSYAQQFRPQMVPMLKEAIERRHKNGTVNGAIPDDMREVTQQAADDFEQKNYDAAAAIYQAMIKAHPDSLYAWSNLGVVRFQQGRYPEAHDAFKQALVLNPMDALCLTDLGNVYVKLDDLPDALATLETAVNVNPSDPSPHDFLSLVFQKMGNAQAAEAERQKANALGKEQVFNTLVQVPPPGTLPAGDSLQARYLRAYLEIDGGNKDLVAYHPQEARGNFSQALAELKSIQAADPEWEKALVTHRIAETEADLAKLDQSNPANGKVQNAMPATTVIVHVQDADSSPLAGASARVEGPGISTDLTTAADGLVTISLPATLPKYLEVHVRKDGYVPKLISWTLDQPSFTLPSDFNLQMEKAQSIGGVVRNESGQPVAGANVVLIIRGSSMGGMAQQVFNDIWERRVTTDKDGKWHFDEAPSDLRPLQVRLEHPDYVSDEEITSLPSDAEFKNQTALLVLRRGTPVDGVVTDENGKAISGVDVVFGEAGSDSTSYPSTQTDAAGHFHFGGLSIKGWSMPSPILTFTSDNYAPEMVELKPSAASQTLDVQLKPGERLRVQLTDQQGRPIKDVTLCPDNWRGHRPFGRIRLQSDENGNVVWDHAPDDPITYAMLTDSFQSQNLVLQPKDDVQVIRLKRQTVVSGRVLDATTQQPITTFDLIFGTYFPPQVPGYTGWARGAALHFQGDSYRYVFSSPAQMDSRDGIAPGVEGFHRIRIEAPGYEPGVSRPIANDEESVPIDFRLKPAPVIHGVVTTADGTPVRDAQVIVAGPGNPLQIINGVCRSKWDQLSVNTNARGEYDLPPQEEDFPIAIIQPDAGYLTITYGDLKASPNVKLLPWGELDISTTAKEDANPQYFVRYVDEDRDSSPKQIRFQTYKPSAFQSGSIIYKQLVAGPIKIGKFNQDNNEGQVVQIESGKTTQVDLRTGKNAVMGKISLPPGASTDYPLAILSLRPVVPDPPFPPNLAQDQRRAWIRNWITTPEGKAYQAKSAEIPFSMDGGGNFRIDDVSPGSYQLVAIFLRSLPTDPQAKADVLGVVQRKFELTNEARDCDLGTLPIQTDIR